ncbi:hypothetical protein GCM10025760_30940 [Microbacterium yannicii]|uniref:Tfp pilus assembly protein PilO n=2 Tax=Microbacterium yannicii TaxID=671622 RepID=A0ABP9MID7_9MICO
MQKQFINVVGTVVVAAVLAAGILLIGMPVYFQSLATSAQTRLISQNNDLYQSQVDLLNEEDGRLDEINADVAVLRTQIPATAQTEDLFEIVASAAATAGATVLAVNALEPVPWTTRTGPEDTGAVDLGADSEPSGPRSEGSADAAADPGRGTAEAPELQVAVSISLALDDPAQAAAFLDALGMGPRLLAVTETMMESVQDGYHLDVQALAFVRTEE